MKIMDIVILGRLQCLNDLKVKQQKYVLSESESEDGDISDDNSKINTLTKIFRNKLCREWIIRNYDINIAKK